MPHLCRQCGRGAPEAVFAATTLNSCGLNVVCNDCLPVFEACVLIEVNAYWRKNNEYGLPDDDYWESDAGRRQRADQARTRERI